MTGTYENEQSELERRTIESEKFHMEIANEKDPTDTLSGLDCTQLKLTLKITFSCLLTQR